MSQDDRHASEEALRAARKAKAQAIRERGENPFANDLWPAKLSELGPLRGRVADAKNDAGRYDKEKVAALSPSVGTAHVAGRILLLRGFGRAAFLRLRDRTGELQLYLHEGKTPEAELAKLDDIQLGDVIEAEGELMATDKGELSLEVTRIRLLTKAFLPLPDKWHGLADVETRYRQRYVDLIATKNATAVFRARSHIVRAVRRYLDDDGFLEVETPTLHTLVGGAAAKPFTTHHNAQDMNLFLRIAPELYLKRLVVGGLERVYELGRMYRNEGLSTRHNPEFTMLEFYEAYATYETLMTRTEALFRTVDADLAKAMPDEHAAWRDARPFALDEPFARVPMRDAVLKALEKAGLPNDVHVAIREEGAPVKEWSKSSERAKKRIDWSNYLKGVKKCGSDGEALFAAYEYLAEPFLAEDYTTADGKKSLPVFIIDYPAEVSPLARRKDSDPSLVDRFELFVHGRELCNAFSELADPEDQAARFREQLARKARGDEETMDYDADYIRALEHGLPPTAGFGMGIDRLVMALTSSASIRDVILFPLLRPEH